MKRNVPPSANPGAPTPSSPKTPPQPITVLVAYDWEMDEANPPVWPFIKKTLVGILEGIEGRSDSPKRRGAFKFRVGRMRAHHGADVLAAIVRRCQEADIVVFDISSKNPNVMLELGVALGAKGAQSGQVFVLSDEDAPNAKGEAVGFPSSIPSDLRGYFISLHRVKGNTRTLVDYPGFCAAVAHVARTLGRERGMFEDPRQDVED